MMADTDNISNVGAETSTATPQDAVLSTLAKDDDASKYIEQRQDDLREEQGLEPEKPAEKNKVEEALQEARERTRQAREADSQLDREYQEAEQAWQAQQQQEQQRQNQRAQELAYHEARGRLQERTAQLRQHNPAMHQHIADNLMALESVLSPEQVKALETGFVSYPDTLFYLGILLSADNGDGKTLTDKIYELSNDTPKQISEGIAQAAAFLEQEKVIKARILQDRIQQGRRISGAPAPFKAPSGGVNPPRDIYRAADKSDASDYIKMRRAQIARASREG